MPWLINSTEILHKDLMKLSTAAFLIFALHNLNAWKRPQIFPVFQTVFLLNCQLYSGENITT